MTLGKFTTDKLQDRTTKYRLSPIGIILVDRENSNTSTDDISQCQGFVEV